MRRGLRQLNNIVVGGVLIIGMVSVFALWRSGSQLFQNIGHWFSTPQPKPQSDVRAVMINKIRGASELATAVFAMEAIVPAKQDFTLGNFTLGRTTLLYIAYGEVRAGVDLSQLKLDNIQIRNDAIDLTLPQPQILDAKIDVNRSSVYDYDRGFLGLGPDSAPQLQILAGQTALHKILEVACSQNILQTANERAKLAVGQLLSSVADKPLTVKTQAIDPRRCVLPPTTLSPEATPIAR